MEIQQILQLTKGSIIELNKLADEPLEVFINEKLIAKAEAVAINEKIGIRIVEIVNPINSKEKLETHEN